MALTYFPCHAGRRRNGERQSGRERHKFPLANKMNIMREYLHAIGCVYNFFEFGIAALWRKVVIRLLRKVALPSNLNYMILYFSSVVSCGEYSLTHEYS